MLNDFIFSLNSALPIFVVLFGGFLLKRHGLIDEDADYHRIQELLYSPAHPRPNSPAWENARL